MSFARSRARTARAILTSALAAATLAACADERTALEPAPFVQPAPGTVYRYAGFSNRIVAADGWTTRFVDDSGRQGRRVALFVTDDPLDPAEVDSGELAKLWPLAVGKQTVATVRQGDASWRWMLRVVGEDTVIVPAGSFRAFVVQAVQTPGELTDPARQTTVGYTWWYAPSVAAVVRFRTTYLSGPSIGNVAAADLRAIDPPPPD